MGEKAIHETACAILALTTHLAWTEDMPQVMPRRVVRRMLDAGALEALVLRDTPEIEEKWFDRALLLLRRVSDVHECLEAYKRDGYTILLHNDTLWPSALRVMGGDEPLFLFAKGDSSLLGKRRISVAGSRKILRETQTAAQRTGQLIAEDGAMLVTGGASGVDSAALYGSVCAGGCAAIVPAMPAARILEQKTARDAFARGRLMLLCDTLPDEPFSAAKALGRNHTLYALGEASLVVAARNGRGGSWRGATDCMRGKWSPVYVWDGENADTAGNRVLMERGAQSYSLNRPICGQLAVRRQQTSLLEGAQEDAAWT